MAKKNNGIAVYCAHDEMVEVAKLKPNPANPNKHPPEQIALLAKIIKAQGWRNPIVVSNRSGLMTKGHARLAAASRLGCSSVPVDRQDYGSEKEELADMIADNRIAELAEADRTMLRELAEQLDDGSFDMDLTGFDSAALEELMTAAPPETGVDAEPQIDKAEELRAKWGVKRGQIWELGEHRLMCGDSSISKELLRLLNGDLAQMVMADPPYNVKYTGGSTNENPRPDSYADSQTDSEYQDWLTKVFENAFQKSDENAAFHVWFASSKMELIQRACEKSGWVRRTMIVWNKLKAHYGALGAQYKHRFEPLFYLHKAKESPRWNGDSNECTVWDEEQPRINELHPTMKPTPLYARSVRNHTTSRNDIVVELFSGSGTTIIACEQLGRKCRAMEIDPGYVAVAIQRWVDATGKTPKLLK